MLDELEKMLKTDAPVAVYMSKSFLAKRYLGLENPQAPTNPQPLTIKTPPGSEITDDITIPNNDYGTYGTATNRSPNSMTMEDVKRAIALINEPVSMGVSSRGYRPEIEYKGDTTYIPSLLDVNKYVNSSLEEAAEAVDSISLSKISYNPSDYLDYSNYVSYNNADLFTDSPAIGDATFTIAASNSLPPDTISISNGKGSIVVHLNGDIEVNGDISIKEASKTFWDSISYYAPSNQDTITKLEREVADLKARLQSYEVDKKFPEPSPRDSVGIRLLTEDIKKSITAVLKTYMFEPNDDKTRKYIKADVDSLLEEYVGKGGICDFATVCDNNNNNSSKIGKGEKHVDITIKPGESDNFIYLPIVLKPTPPKDEPACENQLSFDLEAMPSEPESGYFYAPYIPLTKTNGFDPYSYDPYSIQEDFIFPNPGYGRGSKVETLPGGQGLGALDDLEYFQRKVTESMAIPADLLQASRQLDILKASLAITPPSIVVDKDSEIGKHFVNQLRANKFDDAMEVIK
jgi:hypothetical protein